MKFNARDFKFETKARRFKKSVWEKYYSLKKKNVKDLSEFDKFWVKQLRAQIKIDQFKLVGTHLPTKISTEWTIKKDSTKKKIDKTEYLQKVLAKVKEKRESLKKYKTTAKNFEGANYTTIGGIFDKPGQITPLASHLTCNNPLAPKKPRRKDKNYIGVELEFNMLDAAHQSSERAAIADALKAAGLAKYVDVTTDGSCGWEVRVLLLEDEFEDTLTKILNVLNGFGFKTNDQCGTHVHLDMRNRDVNVVYENLFKTQKFLRKFLSNKRKRNRYCKLNTAPTFAEQNGIGDRYYAINVDSYRRHQTIEVRMHQGTLKADELIPWISLLTKIVGYKSGMTKTINTLKQAKETLDIDEVLTQDLEQRIMSIFNRKKVAAPTVISPHAAFGQVVRPGAIPVVDFSVR
jgi:hypothetical protein